MSVSPAPVQGDFERSYRKDLETPDTFSPELTFPEDRQIKSVYDPTRRPQQVGRAFFRYEVTRSIPVQANIVNPGFALDLDTGTLQYEGPEFQEDITTGFQPRFWFWPMVLGYEVEDQSGASQDIQVTFKNIGGLDDNLFKMQALLRKTPSPGANLSEVDAFGYKNFRDSAATQNLPISPDQVLQVSFQISASARAVAYASGFITTHPRFYPILS